MLPSSHFLLFLFLHLLIDWYQNFLAYSTYFKFSSIFSMPLLINYRTCPISVLFILSYFNVHTHHPSILLKRKILIQYCGWDLDPVLVTSFQRCQCCWSADQILYRKVTGNIFGIGGTEMINEILCSRCTNLSPPLTSHWPWENWPNLFENQLSLVQNKDLNPHDTGFLQWLGMIFILHKPQEAWNWKKTTLGFCCQG